MTDETRMSSQRSPTWRRIWENKYTDDHAPVHQLDGFDLLSAEQWTDLVSRFCDFMGPTEGKDILEVGCGAGAFLQHIEAPRSLAGIDYSYNAIEIVRRRLEGQFFCSEANTIPFSNDSFDIVFSFGVFFYFETLTYAEDVLREMVRVVRPGGRILILDVNDEEKIGDYHRVRGTEIGRVTAKKIDTDTSHLFFRKEWFKSIGKSIGAEIAVVDETELGVDFHSGCEYRFAVRFDIPT